jgi:hypothetical protein
LRHAPYCIMRNLSRLDLRMVQVQFSPWRPRG